MKRIWLITGASGGFVYNLADVVLGERSERRALRRPKPIRWKNSPLSLNGPNEPL